MTDDTAHSTALGNHREVTFQPLAREDVYIGPISPPTPRRGRRRGTCNAGCLCRSLLIRRAVTLGR